MATPQQDTVAQGRFNVGYDQLTPQQRLAVDAVVREIYGASATQEAQPTAPRQVTSGGQAIGLDPQTGEIIYQTQLPQSPPQVHVSVAQPPAQDAQRFMYNGQPWLQLETRTPGQDAKVQYQNTVTGEIVTNLPAPTAAATPASGVGGPGDVSAYTDSKSGKTTWTDERILASGKGDPIVGYTQNGVFVRNPRYTGSAAPPAAAAAPTTPGAAPAAPGAPQTQQQAPAVATEGTGRDYSFGTAAGGQGKTEFDPVANESRGISGAYAKGPNSITGLEMPKNISIKDQYGNYVRYDGGSGLASGIGTATGIGGRGRVRDLIKQGFFNDQPTLPQEVSLDDQPFRPLTEEELASLPNFAEGGNVLSGLKYNERKPPDFSGLYNADYLQERYNAIPPGRTAGGGIGKTDYIPESYLPYLKGQVMNAGPGQTGMDAPKGYTPYWQPNSELAFVRDPKPPETVTREYRLGNWNPVGGSGNAGAESLRAERAANPLTRTVQYGDRGSGYGANFWNNLTNPSAPDVGSTSLVEPGEGGGSQFLQMLMKLLGLGMAEGGTLMSDEPTMGIGMNTGQPKFMLGEQGPEMLQITPTQQPMRQETNPALLNLFAQTSAKKTRFMTPMGA